MGVLVDGGGLVVCMSCRPVGIQTAIVRGRVWVYRSVYAVPTARHTDCDRRGVVCAGRTVFVVYAASLSSGDLSGYTCVGVCVFVRCLCGKLILGQPVGVHTCECVCLCVVYAASLSSGNLSGYICVNVCVCVCVPSWSHFGILSGNGL